MDQQYSTAILERDDHRWGVILAGGDGTRLKPLTRKIAGDERPKQFCPVLGNTTLLEETRRRAALELAPEHTLYAVNRRHSPYYETILCGVPGANLVAQPDNRGTAPAILYSLLRIAVRDPRAIVAFFPSDHYVSNNQKFMAQVRAAIDIARRRPDLIVLLGVEPETPEVEYGWIEPATPIRGQRKVYRVRRFWEKPDEGLAQVLQLRGCLWNSFVMVGSAQTLLAAIESAAPELYRAFSRLTTLFGTAEEDRAVEQLYGQIPEINFSHQVLAQRPENLAVIRVAGVRWNDLGAPDRVFASLDMAGIRPRWVAALPQVA